MLINKDINKTYNNILSYIDTISIISTHEHTDLEETRNKKKLDFFYLLPSYYVISDILKSGLPDKDFFRMEKEDVRFEEKWNNFIKYWPLVENTTYARVFKIILKDLFDVTKINKKSAVKVEEILRKTNKKGYYKKILKDKCNIKTSILDFLEVGVEDYKSFSLIDRELFSPVMKFDDFINVNSAKVISAIEETDNISIHSFKNYENIFIKRFNYFLDNKAIGIKIAISYFRTLEIEKYTRDEAERAFNKVLKIRSDKLMRDHEHDAISFKEIKPFQDFILYKLFNLAEKYNLPVQIHTGFLEGSGKYLNYSNPELLLPIFMEFEKVNFDIFHLSFPYTDSLIAIAKMFRNVYVDFCWSHMVSESISKNSLEKCIEVLPITKIFGFGGDYTIVEGTYAHLKIAKENISEVLTNLVIRNRIDLKSAYKIAEMILNQNISRVFNI